MSSITKKPSFYEHIQADDSSWEDKISDTVQCYIEWQELVRPCLNSLIGDNWIDWHGLSPVRQDYLIAILQESLKIGVGTEFNYRIIIENYKKMSQVETSTLINSNSLWQRKVVEVLVDLHLVREAGEDLCKRAYYQGLLKSLKHLNDDLNLFYGCAGPEIEKTIEEIEHMLKKLPATTLDKIIAGPFKHKLACAIELASRKDQFVLGGYFEFSARSGQVHFDLTYSHRETVHPAIAMRQPIWTIYALARVAVLVAELGGCKAQNEIANLDALSYVRLLPSFLVTSFNTQWTIGEVVQVPSVSGLVRGKVSEVEQTKFGYKKLRVNLENGESEWFPAIAVKTFSTQ